MTHPTPVKFLFVCMALGLLAGWLGGCTDDDVGTKPACSRFVVFDGPGWELKESVDYPEDLGDSADAFGRYVDWYSEFERVVPAPDGESAEGSSLLISGQVAGLEDFGESLPGADLTERQGPNGPELVTSGSDSEPSVLAQSVTNNYTLMLLSYGLDLDELTDVAATTRPACEKEWLDAGGQILDCVPPEPGCTLSE